MKRLIKVVFALMLSLTTIFGSFSTFKAETETTEIVSAEEAALYQEAVYYFYKISNAGVVSDLAQLDTYKNARADVERKIWEISKTNPTFAQRAKKIFDFWQQADAAGFTNVYHADEVTHKINKEEMYYDFPNDNSVAIFMYGNAMDDFGNMSAENKGRCETVLALAQQYPNAYIILSGGHTQKADKSHQYEPKYVPQYDSEAGASFKYLTQTALQPTYMDGTFIPDADPVLEEKYIDPSRPTIDPSRIILDECAQTTVGNIKNSMVKLEAYPQIKNFIAVTGAYHIPRASLLLMSYIYSKGYDLPESEGGRGYKYVGNLGYYISKSAESNSSMDSGAGSVIQGALDVSYTFSIPTRTPYQARKISTPNEMTVVPAKFSPLGLTDVADLFESVNVTFTAGEGQQSADGFVYDAKKVVTVEGFDKDKLGTQHITVKYTYNNTTLTKECDVNIVKPIKMEVVPASYTFKGTNDYADLFKSVNITFIDKESVTDPEVKTFIKDVKSEVIVPDFSKYVVGEQRVTVKYSIYGVDFKEKCTVNVVDPDAQAVIKDLILYFTNTSFTDKTPLSQIGQATYADVERKFQELEAIDPQLALKWRLLINDWKTLNADGYTNVYHVNADFSINTDEMVFGLPNDDSVAIFMYGNAMDASGNMSAENKGRCDTVIALAQQYPNAYIILSGGHTQTDDKKHASEPKYVPQYDSEAGASFKYLTQTALQPTYMDGTFIPDADPVLEEKYIDPSRPTIDPKRIILDECAQDTVGNIKNSMAKLTEYPEIKHFITVTSDYHIPRATLLLLAYIRTKGLDYDVVDNLGFAVVPTKTESIAIQRMSFTGVVNVNVGFMDPNPTISTPKNLFVAINGQNADDGTTIKIDQNDLTYSVKAFANFENADPNQNCAGFLLDVSDRVVISNYDKNSKEEQTITVSYTYNGVTASKEVKVINVDYLTVKDEKDLENKINSLQKQLESLLGKLDTKVADADDELLSMIEALKAQIEALKEQVEEVKKQAEEVKGQTENIAKENQGIAARVEEINNEVSLGKTIDTILAIASFISLAGIAFVAFFKGKKQD